MTSFKAMELDFVDLASSTDVDYHLDALFQNLKKIFDATKTGEGFWGNRELIKKNAGDVVIAVEKGTNTQVGFYCASVDERARTITGYIIQSFQERRGIATALINRLTTSHPGYALLVEEPLEASRWFWESYFKKNPPAASPPWLAALPHRDGARGPLFHLKAPLSKAEFVQILAELGSEYGDDEERVFEPLRCTEGGIKVVLKQGGHLELSFVGYGFPWVGESWEETWKADQRPALATQSFKSSIGSASSNLQWQPEDLYILKRVFQRHGVAVDFFIHTK